jgi:hypothetical protein
MASLKQTIVNRLNSTRSTGPRAEAGKLAASRNAITHGLSRIPTTPPSTMAEAIAARMSDWWGDYRPVGKAQEWHFEQLCAESVRLDACQARILAARIEAAERASESWDDDRSAEIAALAEKLPECPEVIQPKLLQSRHGVLWMLEQWGNVAADLERCDGWNFENWFRALDLLGVPIEGRKHSGPWDIDPTNSTAGPGLELTRNGIEALKSRLGAYLDARDARHREAAELGLDADPSRSVRLLERYAADARRQVARNRDELRRLQSEAARAPSPTPRPAPPGPRPDRSALSARSHPGPSADLPGPGSAPAMTSPDPAPSPIAPPASTALDQPARVASPTRPAIAPASIGARFGDRTAPGNRNARRAQAAARRS